MAKKHLTEEEREATKILYKKRFVQNLIRDSKVQIEFEQREVVTDFIVDTFLPSIEHSFILFK